MDDVQQEFDLGVLASTQRGARAVDAVAVQAAKRLAVHASPSKLRQYARGTARWKARVAELESTLRVLEATAELRRQRGLKRMPRKRMQAISVRLAKHRARLDAIEARKYGAGLAGEVLRRAIREW